MKDFRVYHKEYLDDGYKVFAADSHYGAALQYAEWYNVQTEYSLLDDSVEKIEVMDMEGVVYPYKIHAEKTIRYYADDEKPEYPFKKIEMPDRTFHTHNMEAFHPDKIKDENNAAQ